MPWFRVDDGLPQHPKVLGLRRGSRRLAAMGAWTLAGAWCAAHPSQNGVVPDGVLDDLGVSSAIAADLVDVGMWVRVEGGYIFHDFHDYNPTAEEDEARKLQRSAAGKLGGLASGRARRAKQTRSEPLHRSFANRSEANEANANPVPDPSPSLEEMTSSSLSRASRAPSEPAGFAEWYAAYPIHKGRRAAAAAYARALRNTAPQVLLEAARRLADDPTRDPAYTPHPATWLNQGRWDDEGPARPHSTTPNRAEERQAAHLALIARFTPPDHPPLEA